MTSKTTYKQTEIGEIPEDWEVNTISNLDVEIIDGDRGLNYPKQGEFLPDGYCLFLSTKNVPNDKFDFTERFFVTADKDKLLRKGKLQRDDMVLTTRGTVGNIALFDKKVPYDNIRINSGMVILRNKGKDFNLEFLYQLLKSGVLKRQYISFSSGSAQPQLPIKDLKDILLVKPPLEEQKKIADILYSLDYKIELNRNMNKTLEEIGKALFKRWFVDFEFPFDFAQGKPNLDGKPYKSSGGVMVDSELGEIPEGWWVGKLKDLIKITSGKRPKVKVDDKTEDYSVPIVGASGIMGYTFDILYDEKIIVTGRVGTLGVVQKIEYPCWMSDNALVIQSEYHEYVYGILSAIDYSTLNVGSTQPLVTQSAIKDLDIVIPRKLLLQKFELIVGGLTRKIKSNNEETEMLKGVRDSLLPRLMSGKLRVN